ncbi:hypothetical protein QWZ13_10855 [Reinekea marina]|uniref:hypothetical protein n=1 Tax=Reinekea marina TaxID=1310421 RepID=UPI0025B42955|nr:hypothetical protein [Reinekea marina]MDN3649411.1 hypothetical protein [Reinekea marina]
MNDGLIYKSPMKTTKGKLESIIIFDDTFITKNANKLNAPIKTNIKATIPIQLKTPINSLNSAISFNLKSRPILK